MLEKARLYEHKIRIIQFGILVSERLRWEVSHRGKKKKIAEEK